MCSQPPKDKDDVGSLMKRNQELIRLMSPAPEYLTITGGEPTLLGDLLFCLIDQLKISLPNAELQHAYERRTFAWPEYTQRFAAVEHPNLLPRYSALL